MENATITLGSNDFYKRVYVRSTRRRHGKPRLPGSFAGGLPHRKCWQMLEPVELRTAMQQCVGAGQHYGIEFGRIRRIPNARAHLEQGIANRLQSKRCRSEEHTSELQSLMRISYAVFCLKKKKKKR